MLTRCEAGLLGAQHQLAPVHKRRGGRTAHPSAPRGWQGTRGSGAAQPLRKALAGLHLLSVGD